MDRKVSFTITSLDFAHSAGVKHKVIRDVIKEMIHRDKHRKPARCFKSLRMEKGPSHMYLFGISGLILLVKQFFLTDMWTNYDITKDQLLQDFPFLEAALEHVPDNHESPATIAKRHKEQKQQQKERGEIIF